MPARKLTVAPYRWNTTARRYIRPNGQFVPRAQIRQALDTAIAQEATHMQGMLVALRVGTLSLDGWLLGMRESVKLVHLWSAAAARGGWAQLSQADYGTVGQELRFHYDRLQRFAEEIANGLSLDGRAALRVRLYTEAARVAYHAVEQRVALEAGLIEERNIATRASGRRNGAGCRSGS
jgi:hypothetical protein